MPEAKNNFLKGRMNKDLDERLLQNGEYRDARNVSVSGSDTGNSGSIENVIGNIEATDFGITDTHVEIIGYFPDSANNKCYFFLTNYTDSSPDLLSRFASSASGHYIFEYNTRSGEYNKLVEGSFLNFSKTHPILGVNLIEDLLFWNDNRNQPRKINVKTASQNSSNISTNPYYAKEEHVSVAKYYPYNPIRLYELDSNQALNTYNDNLLGSITSLFDSLSGDDGTHSYTVGSGTPVAFTSGSGSSAVIDLVITGDTLQSINVTSGGSGFVAGDTITFQAPVSGDELVVTLRERDLAIKGTMVDSKSKDLPFSDNGIITTGSTGVSFEVSSYSENLELFIGCLIYVLDSSGTETVSISEGVTLSDAEEDGAIYEITLSSSVTIGDGSTIYFGANPYYDSNLAAKKTDLRDKFVRFAYRFRFDDNEYSLISPFTQSVFIPKQDGYFLGDSNDIDADEQKAIKNSIVGFFENKVTKATLLIDLPEGVSTASDLESELKVKEVDIIFKDSTEPSLKVLETIPVEDLSSTNGYISYEYKSNKPFKTLPERELTRVYDKVPVRAKAQEVVGNRLIMGGIVPELSPPESLDFSVESGEKNDLHDSIGSQSKFEYPLHTLKQNRTYQVGVVLSDKFGRQSDVIVSNNSTIKHEYRDSESPLMTSSDIYLGDSLKVVFNEPIPEDSPVLGYKGVYNSVTNPLGWYSYKIVVKQLEQSYHNCYVPSILNGYPVDAADVPTKVQDTAYVTLINDNINKIPRSLDLSADGDAVYKADVAVYPRVSSINYNPSQHSTLQQGDLDDNVEITSIGIRDDLGLQYKSDGTTAYITSPFFGIPDQSTSGENPFIAKISTNTALGSFGGDASGYIKHNALRLDVLETEPTISSVEIFYETSTAGLISELNEEVTAVDAFAGTPFQVDSFGWDMTEATPSGTVVTNAFTIQDVNGDSILNSDTTAEIVSVADGSDNWTDYFSISKNGSNKFLITWDGGKDHTILQNYRPSLDFRIKFKNVVSGSDVFRDIYIKGNRINNEIPYLEQNNTNYGSISQEVKSSYVFAGNDYTLLTGWRKIANVEIRNGGIVSPYKESIGSIKAVEYFSSFHNQWFSYNNPFLQNNGLSVALNPLCYVRILKNPLNSPSLENFWEVWYSPALQSIRRDLADPWPRADFDQVAGNFKFTFDPNVGYISNSNVSGEILEGRASRLFSIYSSDIYRATQTSRTVDTLIRVKFDVYDANGSGLSQEQSIQFTLAAAPSITFVT